MYSQICLLLKKRLAEVEGVDVVDVVWRLIVFSKVGGRVCLVVRKCCSVESGANGRGGCARVCAWKLCARLKCSAYFFFDG